MVGLADTSTKRQCSEEEIWSTTDTQQSFGAMTAKHYDADYEINAISGRGVVRNFAGSAGDLLPDIYPYTFYNKSTKYDDPKFRPQIVVLALGGNDFLPALHSGEKWTSTESLRADYIAALFDFIKKLRERQATAFIVLLAYGNGEIYADYASVLETLKASGETRIGLLAASGLARTGCNWHITIEDHEKIATSLIEFLDHQPEVWATPKSD